MVLQRGYLQKHLRKLSYASVVYVDDSYLKGGTYQKCFQNVVYTTNILRELGFLINLEKLILAPRQM